MVAETFRRGVALDVVVAHEGEVGHLEPPAKLVEEAELRLGRVLDVVADELDEVGANPRVNLVDDPVRGPVVIEPGLREVEIAGDHEGDGQLILAHGVLR